ncbi:MULTISPECIES: ATP-binding protein [Micromonospora]|uniref:Sensor-like histidine kinase SenX3 n=1 Tax=Micromonospora chalcea TaxID=1874 RepID=A0ABX9Y9U9_MICCH|nr:MULTISPECIES: ATP-binding protein [Micromonospora]EWM66885.1 His Kinase A (phosphoacceptor) protein [Micromonospora sp. M42]MBC8989626.1 PAS domain-containing protein [Micromonospora chalcea]MBP1786281.1 signal transduction histidine kinase [Micromonospora sp. HB375]MBQ1060620.1 PAS domain-containing protein [Micromonospora sp. C41]MBQ1066585.1 PAS domain-containing protein [Micromonospora sp. D75]
MPERTDYPALIAGHTTVINMINAGESGPAVLNRLLHEVGPAVGAAGLVFVEFTPAGGRVIAATGRAEFVLGRPLPATDPATVCLLAGPPVREVRVDAIPGALADEVAGRGLSRMIVARAEIGGLTVGSLHALYPLGEPPDAAQRAVIGYVAACVAHMYGDQTGLPVHGDGPVVAALADGLAVVDRDGRIRLWNPAAVQVTGRPAEEALSRPLPFPLPPPGQVLDHRMPDGRWLRITSGELPGPNALRVVTFRDVTDQQRRDHDRDLFVAVTSHELRTPVTVIKGYADTLTDHWDSLSDDDRRQAARIIGQRANELARLVDRLLTAATENRPGGEPAAPFDLVDALRAAATDLPADIRHRVVLDLPADLPKALGDRHSLATVLTELGTNAGKYSLPDTPIEVTAEANERTVSFRVADRGIGIRPEHVERAFDRFWQGESGDRRRYPGAGLGLYLVRQIVEQQNGWVSLRPRAGGGTVAEVRLPRG